MADSGSVLSILDEYHHFLMGIDTWFRSVRVKYGHRMQCGRGCIFCCCGLFDVPLPDAFRVAAGFGALPSSERQDVARLARDLHSGLLAEAPELKEPYFLDAVPEDRVELLVERFSDVRCPFLTADGDCLIYEYRPSACILEGVPMVDFQDGPFDDWCALNFTDGIDRDVEKDLVLDYYGIETTVQRVSEQLTESLPALSRRETTVFIPSIVVAFDRFWHNLLQEEI